MNSVRLTFLLIDKNGLIDNGVIVVIDFFHGLEMSAGFYISGF